MVLVSSFSDAAALHAYLDHPRHREVSAVLGPMRVARSVLDFPAAGLQP